MTTIRVNAPLEIDEGGSTRRATANDLRGVRGPTGYDTAPVGAVVGWTASAIPFGWGLANGQRLARSAYPEAYDFAKTQADAGSSLWTYRTSDFTFTVPNLTDKFLLGVGAKALGATGGEENHTLTTPEIPSHSHSATVSDGRSSTGAGPVISGTGAGAEHDPLARRNDVGFYTDIGVSIGSTGGGGAHNNMPPYVVLGWIVKLLGVTDGSTSWRTPIIAPVATGNATQDTATLQALFDRGLATAPVTIELPPGQNYSITELVPRSGVILNANWSKLTATTGSVQGIINNRTAQVPVDNFEVRNAEFVGQGQEVGTLSERRGAVLIYNGSRIRLHDNYLHDFSDHGLSVRNGQDVRIQNNTAWNITTWGSGNCFEIAAGFASNTSAPMATTRCIISGNVTVNIRAASICVQSLVKQSEMTGATPAAINPVPQPTKDFDVIVCDNPYLESVAEATAAHGFAVIALEVSRSTGSENDTGTKIPRVHIHHNHCRLIGAPTTVTLHAIACSDNYGSSGTTSTDFDELSDVVIDHNTIDSIDGGIMSQASRSMIDHNVIRSDLRGITVNYNGNAAHLPEQIQVDSNIIHLDGTKATGDGVLALVTKDTTIKGNRITYYGATSSGQTPRSNGIYANGCTNINITGDNIIKGATAHGIYMNTVVDYSVTRNTVLNPSSGATNTYDALNLTSCTGNTNIKGSVRYNDMLDDRGASKMMRQCLYISGGTPRLIAIANRMVGFTSGPVTGLTTSNTVWWEGNEIGSGTTGPFAAQAITIGTSPFSYVPGSATLPTPHDLVITGGTVSKIELKRASAAAVDTGLTSGVFHVTENQTVIVTHTGAPTATAVPDR